MRMTRAGMPATTAFSGTSCVTTALLPFDGARLFLSRATRCGISPGQL
jgi:hypothetical protein